MPTLYHGRGSFLLRRRFRSVGAIRIASGTTDPATFQKLDRMLLTLYDTGRLDLLRAIKLYQHTYGREGVHPLEVWERYRVDQLERIPGPDVLPHLASRWAVWLATADTSGANRVSRARAWQLLRRHTPAEGNLTALPRALAGLRTELLNRPRSFNITRAACLAFVRDHLGKRHPLYEAVANIPNLPAPAQVKPRPFRPSELLAHVTALPSDIAAQVWSLALTGMGPKEYLEDGFELLPDYVHIHGAKRGSRDRVVPLLPAFSLIAGRVTLAVVQPTRSRSHLRKLFKASAGARSLYDLRRTYANLLVEAGIPRNRRDHYRGHAAQSMSDLYERPEVASWLREDASRLAELFLSNQSST